MPGGKALKSIFFGPFILLRFKVLRTVPDTGLESINISCYYYYCYVFIRRTFWICHEAKEPNGNVRGSCRILFLDEVSLKDAIDSIGSFIKKSVDDGNKAGTFGIQIDTSQDRGRLGLARQCQDTAQDRSSCISVIGRGLFIISRCTPSIIRRHGSFRVTKIPDDSPAGCYRLWHLDLALPWLRNKHSNLRNCAHDSVRVTFGPFVCNLGFIGFFWTFICNSRLTVAL